MALVVAKEREEVEDVREEGPLSDESKGIVPYKELIRDYEPKPGVAWRSGTTPSYTLVNKTYFQHRSKTHAEGSLEATMSKMMKNWQVESQHIADPQQWKTMDSCKFRAAVNGGGIASAQVMANAGKYNVLLGEQLPQLYSASRMTNEESSKLFGHTFTEGFAWECLEVISGPPNVAFKWRHFGKFSGCFTDKQGKSHHGRGEMLNLYGMVIAKINDQEVIEDLDVYYDPNDLLRSLTAFQESMKALKTDEGDGHGHSLTTRCGCTEAQDPRSPCALM